MNIRYRVDLSQAERDELSTLVSGGKQAVRRLKRMQILLAADAGVSDEAIAASVQTSGSTIYRTKKRFVEISLEADRRIDNRNLLETEVRAWVRRRTESGAKIRWMFSTDQARVKMVKSYPTPSINES